MRVQTAFLLSALAAAGCRAEPPIPDNPAYYDDVRPILMANCVRCHHGDPSEPPRPPPHDGQRFRLDRWDDVGPVAGLNTMAPRILGADAGTVRVGDESYEERMPKVGPPLTDRQIAILRRWLERNPPVRNPPDWPGGARPGNHLPTILFLTPAADTTVDQTLDVETLVEDADGDTVIWTLGWWDTVTHVTGPFVQNIEGGRRITTIDTRVLATGTYRLTAVLDDGFAPIPGGADCATAPETCSTATITTPAGRNATPAVRVVAPNGGEAMSPVSSPHPPGYPIAWTASDADSPGNLTIDIVAHHAGMTLPIAMGLFVPQGTGSYDWSLDGVPAGTDYAIEITATDGGSPRASGSDSSDGPFTIVQADDCPPTFSGAAMATGGSSSATVSWTAAADTSRDLATGSCTAPSSSAIVYLVYVSSTPGGENYSTPPTATTLAGATSYTLPGLAANTTYYFVVRAQDQAGNVDTNTVEVSATTSSTSDTLPPTFAGLSSATAGASLVDLAWTAAADPTGPITYLIYRATSPGGENYSAPTYTTAGTSFTATPLASPANYCFVVHAQDAAGNVDTNTVEQCATTLADLAPTFGGLSSVGSATRTSLALGWTAATDDHTPSSSIIYLVYRAASTGAESYAAPTYTTPAGVTSFVATGLGAGTTYYFVVRARDMAGNFETNTVERSGMTLAPTLSGDVQPIFSSICATSGCHAGARPAQGMNLSSGQTWSNTVGVWSGECPSVRRVESSLPDTSYLVWKLQGSGACFSGSPMPGGSNPPLPQTQIDTIRAWIRVGAPNN